MVKKIAAALNIVIPFLQQCPKWIQVLVTAGFVYVIIVIVIMFIWFLFFRSPQKQKPDVFDSHGRTQLNSRIKKRVDDLYNEIYNEKLKPWIFINTGKPLRVEKHDGTFIQYEGVRFEGTSRLVFWGDDFIPPFIENAIVKAFDQTIEECRKNNLDPKPYIYETNSLLAGFIGNVYNRMADMDRRLRAKRGKGPKSVGRKDVTFQMTQMDKCLKEHYDAAILLASKNGRNIFLNPWVVTIGGGLIVGIILLSLNRGTNLKKKVNIQDSILDESPVIVDSPGASVGNGPIITEGDYVAGNKTVNIVISDPTLEAEVKRITDKQNDELTIKYPRGNIVFGVTQKGFIVPKGLVPPTSEIQWHTAKVLEFTEKSIKVLLPHMIINTESVKRTQIAGAVVSLPKRVNAKRGLLKLPEIRIQVEVIGLHDQMVIIGVGFLPINNEDESNTTKQ